MSSAIGDPPRAAADRELLHAAWRRPPGVVGWLTAVNHKQVGVRFIVTGLVFLLAGGVLALLMRTQLAIPDGEVLAAETYNELFTMHGTTMMFLFAVPMVEGLAMYLLPLLIGTRDLPFPRLNAFGYWTYLFGGLFVYSAFLVDSVPDAGWFAYVPLAGPEFSPGSGMDFWLLGVTFVEIAGVVGAIEILVGFLKRRAPGMSLQRIPLFGWAAFVMAGMMLLAFPVLITGSVLLEMERALGTRFYDPTGGGDPLLWQHLFWFFGHPEVYIMFIPATGIISMVVPVFCRRPIAGYVFVVAALVSIGIVSFGLWIHHMFAVGLPLLALGIFSAASFIIAIPSGVQIFAWIATIWRGRPRLRTPFLFALGFVLTFVMGGITGVMVAAAPFDLQVHDTYFVVAHFHYVLIGGVLFPIFAGLYYWWPKWSGRILGERLGQASFWAMLAGLNLTFFPQHVLGFDGMPRRVFTYPETSGWGDLNLLSTVGAYVLAAGVALSVVNVLRSFARGRVAGDDPWEANTLEWRASSPPAPYNFDRLPVVASADPLWEPDAVRPAGRTAAIVDRLAAPREPVREVLETHVASAEPERIVLLPGPSPLPLATALAIVAALLGILLDVTALAIAGAAVAVAVAAAWLIDSIGETRAPAEEAGVPFAPSLVGWWAALFAGVAVLMALGALIFGYLLFVSDAAEWPPAGIDRPGLPLAMVTTVVAAGLAVVGVVLHRGGGMARLRAATGAAGLLTALFLILSLALLADRDVGIEDHAYGSILFALLAMAALTGGGVLVALAVAGWRVWSGDRPDAAEAGRVGALGLWLVALVWAGVFVTVYITPLVIDGAGA